MSPYVQGIYDIYKINSDAELALPMQKYMRNQFRFFGLKAPSRKLLSAAYLKSVERPVGQELNQVIKELWLLKERELHYFAIELLSKSKKSWTENDYLLHEYLITTNSWWDTVDYLANHVCGPWFKKYPEAIASVTGSWNRSENIWLQRMSLLFQLKYKKEINLDLLSSYIQNLSQSKEFFVQKAIGWVLREHSKIDSKWVSTFVNNNELMPLSKREALKNMN